MPSTNSNASGFSVLRARRQLLCALLCLLSPIQLSRAQEVGRIVWPALAGGPYHGSILPGKDGGMVVGGPLNGSAWPVSSGGMIVGGPLNGTVWPSARGGSIIGGPLNGTVWPSASGGLVVGGPLNGYLIVESPRK